MANDVTWTNRTMSDFNGFANIEAKMSKLERSTSSLEVMLYKLKQEIEEIKKLKKAEEKKDETEALKIKVTDFHLT